MDEKLIRMLIQYKDEFDRAPANLSLGACTALLDLYIGRLAGSGFDELSAIGILSAIFGLRDRRESSTEADERPAGRRRVGKRQAKNRVRARFAGGRRVLERIERIRKLLEELAQHRLGIDADGLGVRAHERSPKDAGGPARDIVAFESLEQGGAHFGGGGDRGEIDPPALARVAKASAEAPGHCAHGALKAGPARDGASTSRG